MCGISGFCSFSENYTAEREKWTDVLAGMREAIAHRGSDQTGEYLAEYVGLSHTRLSIRDVAGGVRAPMLKYVCGSCGYTTSSTIDITGRRCVKCTDGIMRRYIV